MKQTTKLLTVSAVAAAIAVAPAAHAHSYYNLTGAGTVASGDSAVGFGITNSINGTDGVNNNSNGTNRVANGTNTYNPLNPYTNNLIPGTGTAATGIVNGASPVTAEPEVTGNLPYNWYSGQHTTATGVTKRELFTGSSVTDTTGNLTNITGTGNGNSITLPSGQVLTAPATGTWGTNNVAGLWNAYNAKNTGTNASTWGTIMTDLPANGDHPYQAVAGNSSLTGQGLDYGLIHISCGANSAADNCASAGDILTTISITKDADYPQYTGLLDVALYRGADTDVLTPANRNAAANITGVAPTDIQGSNLGAAIWSGHMNSVNDILTTQFVFNQAEWAATDTSPNGPAHTNGFYTLVIGGHGGLATDGYTYDVLVTTSPVPVPGAVWLMGSAMAGLIGFKRRKQAIAA